MIDAPSRTLVGRYEPLRTLGHGGFGTVYEARDHRSGELIALKELTAINPRTLARFKQEFRAVQEVHHPNLVRLDALFEESGKWMIAMELVEGSDLLAHVYSDKDADSGSFDEGRLRDAFHQLAEGLEALHGAGFVHRDLKPANVRVTAEGRVVLLDFGLAITVDPREQSTRAAGHGTVAYMAPEQAASQKVGPAADWYAFGVCLYEGLTGVLPVDAETPFALLAAKQMAVAPRPSAQVPNLPVDLDDLCASLLELDPQARPGASVVRNVLSRGARSGFTIPVGAPTSDAGSFTGRAAELEQLQQALLRARAGATQCVLVEGESGVGKSALVDHFVAAQAESIVLRSRCYENELVPYKAFDGAVDGLAQLLGKLPAGECELLLPARAGLLCRLFPGLAALRVLQAPLPGEVAADLGAQRREAFEVFGRLLSALGERAPVLFSIDDLQWADAESFRLLQAWLDGRAARCLIIATVRPRSELEGEAAAGIAELRARACVTTLPLAGLPHDSAMALARELMGRLIPESWLQTMVRESAGHPLFLTVLARYAESHDPTTVAELTLDAAIGARLSGLSRDARLLLAAVALVGAPLPIVTCGRAVGLGESELGRMVTELCRKKLLRRRRAGEVDCFHNRIRRVAVARLPRKQACELHAQVAAALVAQGNVDPAELGRHYEAAGELAPAHAAYRQAAERAAASLAFERAAMLYARALEVSAGLPLADAERATLQTERGHALARSGRSGDAAHQFLQAAALVQGEAKTRLRIWATQHLLQSARVEEGMAAARALLEELDVPLASTPRSTMLRLTWDHVCLRASGLEPARAPKPITVQQRMQLDALWGIVVPLTWIDPLAGAALSARHVRLARAAGVASHMARALGDMAFDRMFRDPNGAEVDEFLSRARTLADACGEPIIDVGVAFREGMIALVRWQGARASGRFEYAHQVALASCPEHPWTLTIVRIHLGLTWTFLGEHARLAASSARWLAEARERDDQFGLTLIEAFGGGQLRHLMADDIDAAIAALTAAMAPWPREPFSFPHYGEMYSMTRVELYRGGGGARAWLQREDVRLSRSLLLKFSFAQATYLTQRCLANLAAYREHDAAGQRELLQQARGWLRQLQRSPLEQAKVEQDLIGGQIAALEGDRQGALASLLRALLACETAGHRFAQHCLQYLHGALEGGTAGGERQYESLAFFASQGWKHPRRAVAIMCPAIDSLPDLPSLRA